MKNICAGILLFASLTLLPAAELTVPRLEMGTLGKTEGGEFVLLSEVSADLALSGGYKYGINLGFNFELNGPAPVLYFRNASAVARELFNTPLELSYFIGEGDYFCTGEEFTTRFGYAPIGTEFRGFFYFPQGIGGDPWRRYYGIHEAQGTGISLAFHHWDGFIPIIYLYGTSPSLNFSVPVPAETLYSGDFRFLFNWEKVKMETFLGFSFNPDFDLKVRGGIMAYFAPGNNVEFLLQGGIPGWKTGEKITIDNFFFLMEPRLKFSPLGLNITFFYHPVEYLNIISDEERGMADLNVKFYYQKPQSEFLGGLESTFSMKIDKMEDFSLWVTPFASFISGGLQWDAKLKIKALDYNHPKKMFELFFGARTSF